MAQDDERLIHFVTSVFGHDTRNALSAVLGSLDALRCSSSLSARDRRAADRAGRGAIRVHAMTEQMVAFVRLVHGPGLTLARAPVDLAEVARDVVTALPAMFGDTSVDLATKGDTTGTWDAHRMGQALTTLLWNAAAHATTGTPVRVLVDGSGSASVSVAVLNQGPALDSAAAKSLFSPERHRTAKSCGLGVGLFVAHAFAELHGGTLEGASEGGVTRFELVVPRDLPARSEPVSA